ncbi:MAG: EVE domain-containing protein, partial [Candidatus Eisenbacteria bacterium]
IIYHSGGEKQAVGLAVAISDAYPDPRLGNPKRPVVELAAEQALPRPVSLAQVRLDPVLQGSELVRFSRLSIIPFTDAQFRRLLQLAGVEGASSAGRRHGGKRSTNV